jgi:hypothetical protein
MGAYMSQLSQYVGLLELASNVFLSILSLNLIEIDDFADQLLPSRDFVGQADGSFCPLAETAFSDLVPVRKQLRPPCQARVSREISNTTYLALLKLQAGQFMAGRGMFLNDCELLGRSNLDDIAVLQQISSGNLWTTTNELIVDECAIG